MPKKSFFPEDPIIPTRLTNRMFLYYTRRDKSDDKDKNEQSNDHSTSEDKFLFILKDSKPIKRKDYPETMGGKWMLFYNKKDISLSRGMTELDYMWQFVFPLVHDYENTRIISACCSTGHASTYGVDPRITDGVILLFTEDYRNKRDVKQAADCIRQKLYYPKDMFYKTDEATLAGMYSYFGDKCVCLYKYTLENRMYERDEDVVYLWNPVQFDK